jgi:hypothetical protein
VFASRVCGTNFINEDLFFKFQKQGMSGRLDDFCKNQTECKQSVWDWFQQFRHFVSNFAVQCCCDNKIMPAQEEEKVKTEDTSLCERQRWMSVGWVLIIKEN